jgi:hypothetical protein
MHWLQTYLFNDLEYSGVCFLEVCREQLQKCELRSKEGMRVTVYLLLAVQRRRDPPPLLR